MGRTVCTELQCLYKGALYLFFYPVLHAVLAKCDLFHRRNSLCLLRQIFARDRHASSRFSQSTFFSPMHVTYDTSDFVNNMEVDKYLSPEWH